MIAELQRTGREVLEAEGRRNPEELGHPADERPWVGQGAVLIVAGAVLRAGAAFVPDAASALLGLAGLCWVAAFGLLCWRIGPVLWQVRSDGLWGCQG